MAAASCWARARRAFGDFDGVEAGQGLGKDAEAFGDGFGGGGFVEETEFDEAVVGGVDLVVGTVFEFGGERFGGGEFLGELLFLPAFVEAFKAAFAEVESEAEGDGFGDGEDGGFVGFGFEEVGDGLLLVFGEVIEAAFVAGVGFGLGVEERQGRGIGEAHEEVA